MLATRQTHERGWFPPKNLKPKHLNSKTESEYPAFSTGNVANNGSGSEYQVDGTKIPDVDFDILASLMPV